MNLDNFKSVFRNVFKEAEPVYAELIFNECSKRNFTDEQSAMFLAQCGHESAHFTRFVENLNYSTNGLLAVFKKYFPTETIAEAYARKPEMIANKVYADRLGNGTTGSGDGWKYRGRGIIQVTGKMNYRTLEYDTGIACTDNPDCLLEPENSVKSAFWYWDSNDLKDLKDIKTVTRKINGGYNGIEERTQLYTKILNLFKQFSENH